MERSGVGRKRASFLSLSRDFRWSEQPSSSRPMAFPREPGNKERGPLSIRRELASTCPRAGLAPSFSGGGGVQELTRRALRTLSSTCGSPRLSSRRWGKRLASRPPARRGCRLLWPRPPAARRQLQEGPAGFSRC